jgi:glycosyltransferase involved in cell wall biosynthesis
MNQPFFSITIPVYNGQDFLEKAINSVRNQTCQDWELIIIDDASTDRSYNIALELSVNDSRITVKKNTHNLKQSGNLNRCIQEASGEWLLFLPADDFYHPELLEKAKLIIDRSQELQLIIYNHACFGEEIPRHEVLAKWNGEGFYQLSELAACFWLRGNLFGELSSFLIKRAPVIQGAVQFKQFCQTLDQRFWMDFCLKYPSGKFYFMEDIGADVLLHASSDTSRINATGAHFVDFFEFIDQYAFQGWSAAQRLKQTLRLLVCRWKFRNVMPYGAKKSFANALKKVVMGFFYKR